MPLTQYFETLALQTVLGTVPGAQFRAGFISVLRAAAPGFSVKRIDFCFQQIEIFGTEQNHNRLISQTTDAEVSLKNGFIWEPKMKRIKSI